MICPKCGNRMHVQWVTDTSWYYHCFNCGTKIWEAS